MKRKKEEKEEVETKKKSLKQPYREEWKAFTAYRAKLYEKIECKKELKKAKKVTQKDHQDKEFFCANDKGDSINR